MRLSTGLLYLDVFIFISVPNELSVGFTIKYSSGDGPYADCDNPVVISLKLWIDSAVS